MATKTDTQVLGDRAKYIVREYGSLVGKKIISVRPLYKEECDAFAWDWDYEDDACVIIFDDGTAVIPMQDPEGNGAGFLAVTKVSY